MCGGASEAQSSDSLSGLCQETKVGRWGMGRRWEGGTGLTHSHSLFLQSLITSSFHELMITLPP